MSDEQIEQQLRDALTATADIVQPGGDGLMRIQQRIGARRVQQRWLRPLMVMGSVVAVAAISVGGVAVAHRNDNAKVDAGDSPTPTAVPSGRPFPAQGFFPFTSASEESDWEDQYADGHSPWIADPEAVATSWVPNYLGAKDVDQVVDKQQTATAADVTLGRNQSEGGLQPVVVVHLVKFGNAWIVTGASDPRDLLTISSPAVGATVDTPLTVTGPGFGVDEVAKVELRDATTPDLIAAAPTDGFGGGTPQWSATVGTAHLHATRPQDQTAVLVVYTLSAADGGVAQLVAQKVVFNPGGPEAASAGFYGVQGGAIERFDASGKPQGPVDGSTSKGEVFEVRHIGDRLYFTARVGDCIPTLYSLPTSGGTPQPLLSADKDYGIVGFDVTGSDASKVTYLESSGCHQSRAGMGKLVFTDLNTSDTRTIDFPSEPPAIIGDPVWEPDGVHVDAYLRTGMQGYLARYDSTKGASATPSSNACGEYDPATQLTGALTTAPDGTLWFAGQTGSSVQVLSCKDGQPNVELTVADGGSPSSLAVDADGTILVANSDGKVWRGPAGGTATELPVDGGVSYIAW